jgi:hypothetical protein
MGERDLPTYEPREFAAGETPRWRKSLADFPASDGWALDYYLRGAGAGFDVRAAADGDDFLFEVPLASTENLAPGNYRWQGWVSKGAESYKVAEAPVVVKQGFAGVAANTTVDTRSQVKRILDAIDALIEGKATRDQQQYTIAGGGGYRMLMRIPVSELVQLRKEYARLYARERRRERVRRGGSVFPTIKVRFDRP